MSTLLGILLVIIGYAAGSFPSGVVIGRIFGNIDPREHGSGNIGAANVARLLGPMAGGAVILMDLTKGFIPVLLSLNYFTHDDWIPYLVAVSCVVGHTYSLILKFSGGKGVATSFGVILPLFPLESAMTLACFLFMAIITRYISLASLTATIFFIIISLFRNFGNIPAIFFMLFVTLVIFYKHKENLGRLHRGEEIRFRFGKKE